MSKLSLQDYFDNADVDYANLDELNVLIKELELFSKINDLDLHINITDKANRNTKLVMDIEN